MQLIIKDILYTLNYYNPKAEKGKKGFEVKGESKPEPTK